MEAWLGQAHSGTVENSDSRQGLDKGASLPRRWGHSLQVASAEARAPDADRCVLGTQSMKAFIQQALTGHLSHTCEALETQRRATEPWPSHNRKGASPGNRMRPPESQRRAAGRRRVGLGAAPGSGAAGRTARGAVLEVRPQPVRRP